MVLTQVKASLVDAGRAATDDDGLVCTLGRRNAGEAIQTIGDDVGSGPQMVSALRW